MKKILSVSLCFMLILACALSLVACGEPDPAPEASLWDTATYASDTTVGEGAKTVSVKITAEDTTVTLTVKTDEDTLGAALYALELTNDPSFFDTANGIKADWNTDHAYWAFYIGDEYATVGVGDAAIAGGEVFGLVYTVSP